MNTRRRRGLPARLEGVRRRFETWRRTRKVRERIPEVLRRSAVRMAGIYGLNQTAKVLRVNYYGLKKRVEQDVAFTAGGSEADTPSVPEADATAAFVEL